MPAKGSTAARDADAAAYRPETCSVGLAIRASTNHARRGDSATMAGPNGRTQRPADRRRLDARLTAAAECEHDGVPDHGPAPTVEQARESVAGPGIRGRSAVRAGRGVLRRLGDCPRATSATTTPITRSIGQSQLGVVRFGGGRFTSECCGARGVCAPEVLLCEWQAYESGRLSSATPRGILPPVERA